MNVGKMNCRISFVGKIITKTSFGETKKTDGVILTCWAEYQEQTLLESTRTIGTVYEDNSIFGIRDAISKRIDSTMIILKGEDRYEITKISPAKTSRDLALIYARRVS